MLELSFFSSVIARRDEVRASEDWVRDQLTGFDVAGAATVPVACVLTGGTEAMVLEWLSSRGPDGGPVILLALPHSNSLPACLEILARLRQDYVAGRIIVAGHGEWREELALAARLSRTAQHMRSARIGFFGGASSWLAASTPDPVVVQRVWGPEVVPIPLSEVIERYHRLTRDEGGRSRLADRVASLRETAAEVVEPADETITGAVGLEAALGELAAEHRLQAITVKCFDLLEPLGNTGCIALARLNDAGITAACEGDLPTTLTMMVLQSLTGRPCFMANPSDADPARGTVTFAHCSVPLSLVSHCRVRSHFESGIGVGLEGRLGPGVMTVARIGGAGLDDMDVFAGEALPGSDGRRENLCRTQVTLVLGTMRVRLLLERPLGNHHALVPGDHVAAFRAYAELSRAAQWTPSAWR